MPMCCSFCRDQKSGFVFPRRETMRVAVAFSLLVLACGGSSSPQGPVQLQITAAGIAPNAITIPTGAQVRFVNKDTVSHRITSSNCPELSTQALATDETFTSAPLTGPKTCNYNDTVNPGTSFAGTVTILQPGVDGGSGY
jgi:plastocyanin